MVLIRRRLRLRLTQPKTSTWKCAVIMPLPESSSAPVSSNCSESLSINQILRNNSREPLFVPPLYWTNRHLELLQCSFGEPTPTGITSTAEYKFTGENTSVRYLRKMFRYWKMVEREDYLPIILADPDSDSQLEYEFVSLLFSDDLLN